MEEQLQTLVDKLEAQNRLNREEWIQLIEGRTPKLAQYIFEKARKIRQAYYGTDVYIRGLIEFTNYCKKIEFTNYCKNDCYYCGIRRSNSRAHRYRLSEEQILRCCHQGYTLGFRTFVLQGGEDGYFTDERIVNLVKEIRKNYPECAITLSIGERSYDSYLALFEAGADRYLLRHETWDEEHYRLLHPPALSAKHRQQCLWDLKKIGYQVGTGYMVGSPFQTAENLADDMLFLEKLNPQMVGIGPFIPHHDTPFKDQAAGTLELTLYMLGLIRLMLPKVLLPATTALGTIDEKGRELGILAGANVVMPNLSPENVRKDYLLYDNKICTGSEAAECRMDLENRMHAIGYQVVCHRGDSLNTD